MRLSMDYWMIISGGVPKHNAVEFSFTGVFFQVKKRLVNVVKNVFPNY